MKISGIIRRGQPILKHLGLALAAGAALATGSALAQDTVIWNGGSGDWDTSTENWTDQGTSLPTTFADGDNVIFDNSSGGTINVALEVAPLTTTVSAASGDYTISGAAIGGTGSLTKTSGGNLILTGANTFTGKTSAQAGTLQLGISAAGGIGITAAGVPGPLGAPTGADATIELHNGVTLYLPSTEPARHDQTTDRPLDLAGTGDGTVSIRVNDNDTFFSFGAVTPTGTGGKTLALFPGADGNGDREAILFTGGISDSVTDSSPTSLQVNYRCQTDSQSYISLVGANTFTGPITLVKGGPVVSAYLTIGGEKTRNTNVPGTGSLGGGNYPGDISLDTATILNYLSSASQTLSGAISGAGSVIVDGGGTVTLSGANTYSGNTTVAGGSTLVLGTTGDYTFSLTNSSSNKITGAGSATLNGNFTIDASAVTVAVGSWTLVGTTTKAFDASDFSVTGPGTWSEPSAGIWTGADGLRKWTFDTTTGVLTLLTDAVFKSFSYNGLDGSIDNDGLTVNLPVAFGTDLAAIAPTFTVSSGTCNQTSESPPSPTFAGGPVHYIVTDGPTVRDYTVTVNILPAPPGGVGTALRVWLAADAVNPADPTQVRASGADNFVQQWNDSSGSANNAANATESQQPQYVTSALNGKPVLRFVEGNGSRLFLGDISAQFGAPGPDPYPTAANSGTGGASLDGAYIDIPTRGVTGALAGDSDTATFFTGVANKRVVIPWSAALNPVTDGVADPFTVEAWVKSNGAPGGSHVIVQSMRQPGQFGTVNDNGNDRSGWFLRENGTDLVFGVGTPTGAPFYYYYTVAGVVSGTDWQHIVVVYDGDETPVIYVDKVAQSYVVTRQDGLPFNEGEEATIRVLQNTDCPAIIGDRGFGGWLFNGVIDEVAIYPSMLSAGDVVAHFDNGMAPVPATPYATLVGSSNPAGYYRLNEPAAPVVVQEATIFAVGTPNSDSMYSMFGNRDNDERWLGGNWNEVTPGAFRGGRANFSSEFALVPQTGSHIFAYESSPAAYNFLLNGTLIGTTGGDYNAGSGKNWAVGTNGTGNGGDLNGDIAELIIYNRILTPEETNKVGAYLANKYGLDTEYHLPGTILTFGIPGHVGVIDQGAKTIALGVPFGTNLATLAPEFTLFTGTCNQTSGSPPSPTFAGGPVHYIVTDSATDPDTVNDYTVTVTVLPAVGTIVIDLGTGTVIEGGTFGSHGTNLPLPPLPV
ncbi:MAG: autotransporter-associated beta strand repeat-containing protein, partial [Akkermansiaceae bacterium]|nr:autotransporter-associated beta strand repeat-containing protein [Akkermansiaceae bacterium]